ncbi:hypothetical protein BGW42_002458 [Actinomortierella wolfii]|nr:hypothetical protein BGW42_002458 [Actinomortierella wolfii]
MASRMSCGFIVTSCPQLVTLDIAFEGKAFDLDTEGGLCFLGRLQRLEQLVWRQTNGLTQSFPMLYFNGIRRNSWPYDQSHEHVLVQQRTVTVPWFDGSDAKELSLPVLRWMSTEPTDDDRKRMWTNIARCRHLYQLDMV